MSKLLTETEHETLREEVRQIEQDKAEGKWVLVNDRLLVRAAEHIEAQAERDAVIRKAFLVIDLDNSSQQKALEDIAGAYHSLVDEEFVDTREFVEVVADILKKRGLIA